MTDQMRAFAEHYLRTHNATDSARRAGYKHPQVLAFRLLKHPEVKRFLSLRTEAIWLKADVSAALVLKEVGNLSQSNIKDFYDAHGKLKPVHTWSDEMGKSVARIRTYTKNVEAGDGHQEEVHEVILWDKVKALELVMKYFGLMDPNPQTQLESDLAERLRAARRRLQSQPLHLVSGRLPILSAQSSVIPETEHAVSDQSITTKVVVNAELQKEPALSNRDVATREDDENQALAAIETSCEVERLSPNRDALSDTEIPASDDSDEAKGERDIE